MLVVFVLLITQPVPVIPALCYAAHDIDDGTGRAVLLLEARVAEGLALGSLVDAFGEVCL